MASALCFKTTNYANYINLASAICSKTTNCANYINLASALCFINSEFRELS